jgi:hypothetical protein
MRWLSDIWWWFNYHFVPKYRYHVVSLKNPGYSYGWRDTDYAMFYCCFNLLKTFVEEEDPFEVCDWEADEHHKAAANEIKALYEWWTKGRWDDLKKERELQNNIPEGAVKFAALEPGRTHRMVIARGPEFKVWSKFHAELEVRDDENFDRLMKIRQFLWT